MLVALIRLYRATFAGALGGRCRFYPSCSDYAIEAVSDHGAFKGIGFAIARIVRCAPWSAGGVDLPPPAGMRTQIARGRG
jgi:uncharacterized protein